MNRVAILLVALVGCQQRDSRPLAEPPPTPQAEPARPTPPAGIEFADWPTATDLAVNVSPYVAYACGPGLSAEQRWARFGFDKRHGPHFGHYIVVRINPDAENAFKKLAAPLPVGTTVVKEKHSELFPKGPPAEYGAMIKREPGYDPGRGDWEYLYAVRGPEGKVTRGRLTACIECHSHAKHRDYVFRTYLEAEGVAGW